MTGCDRSQHSTKGHPASMGLFHGHHRTEAQSKLAIRSMSRKLMGIIFCAWCNYTRDPGGVPASEIFCSASIAACPASGGCSVTSRLAAR